MQVLWGLYRTYEELKLRDKAVFITAAISLYRTYEELKHRLEDWKANNWQSLYRTYEELKLELFKTLIDTLLPVCIVPMRN